MRSLTRKEGFALAKSPRLFQRFEAAGWLIVNRKGGPRKATLFSETSLMAALERVANGEHPPLLPSEVEERRKRKETKL